MLKNLNTLGIFFLLVIISCQKSTVDYDTLKWRTLSVEYIEEVDSMKHNVTDLHTLSYNLYAKALIYGWNHSKVVDELNTVLSFINQNGFSLNREFDAFGDGTINSETTIYTITLTDHLGPVLLEANKHGAIDDSFLYSIYNILIDIKSADSINNGYCVSYSNSINDVGAGCVHNVNISYAYFLDALKEYNFYENSTNNLVEEIIKREKLAYLPEEFNFLYWDGNDRLTDQNHLCFQAWCMNNLYDDELKLYSNLIINNIMLNREKSISSLIGHLRILPFANSFSDSLYIDLVNLNNGTDSTYSFNTSYNMQNPRIISQLAVWTATYYRHRLSYE